ncbi:MAG: ABC transporter ATP-binding protein [Lachnospiraceae bacterium]|nr:ABC transporter ATP-binding protein [Lachnospiraceae bacterium]
MNTVVKIENLVKRYKELVAVDHMNLSIERGEIFGLLGPNGSGKSTIINCLLSLTQYDKGEITIFGEEMRADKYSVKGRIGVVLQNVAVFDELTVYENIDYFCSLYVKDKAKRKELVKEAIAFVGLEEFVKFYPKKLSGGLLRRLNIACGIAHKPELIIFDEPTVAVDPQSRNKILEGIQELNRQGATVIYTSHYMEEVEQICSRIAIIDKGQLVATGTKEELKSMIQTGETIRVEVPEFTEELSVGLQKLSHVFSVEYSEGLATIKCNGGRHNVLHVLEYLNNSETSFGRVFAEQPTLNDVFLEITGKELRDEVQ